MKKITKILVPVDFSEPSANALRYALQLADKIDASIEVLNIIAPQGEALDYPILVAKATQQRLETARTNLKKFVDTALVATGQVLHEVPMVSSDFEIGVPVQNICDYAQREEVTMIVIGSRGENKSRIEKILGSVAAGVVQKAKCAVLVIPEAATFTEVQKMTYATDIKDADPFEIWKALELLDPFKPSVNLVHVNLNKDGDLKAWKKMEQMKLFFTERSDQLNINFYNVPGTQIEKEINDFVEGHPADLLVMYQGHHNFWDRLFFKSTSKRMALYTKVPLLVLKSE